MITCFRSQGCVCLCLFAWVHVFKVTDRCLPAPYCPAPCTEFKPITTQQYVVRCVLSCAVKVTDTQKKPHRMTPNTRQMKQRWCYEEGFLWYYGKCCFIIRPANMSLFCFHTHIQLGRRVYGFTLHLCTGGRQGEGRVRHRKLAAAVAANKSGSRVLSNKQRASFVRVVDGALHVGSRYSFNSLTKRPSVPFPFIKNSNLKPVFVWLWHWKHHFLLKKKKNGKRFSC